jgi:hypothetical protein
LQCGSLRRLVRQVLVLVSLEQAFAAKPAEETLMDVERDLPEVLAGRLAKAEELCSPFRIGAPENAVRDGPVDVWVEIERRPSAMLRHYGP